MWKLKIPILEAHILLLHTNIEVGVNFTFFCEDGGVWQVICEAELKLVK
jgi:hypothetical protein